MHTEVVYRMKADQQEVNILLKVQSQSHFLQYTKKLSFQKMTIKN